MADNIVNFTPPKGLMPARWRKHSDALMQIGTDIDVLRKRLREHMCDFLEVIHQDVNPVGNLDMTSEKQKVIARASCHLDKGLRDALTLLECASERVQHAAPSNYEFQDWEPSKPAS